MQYTKDYTKDYTKNTIKLQERLNDTPATMTDILISNIDWHARIATAVLNKQEAKLLRDKEQYILETQEKQAQQSVNTANATRDSTKAEADGYAYKTKVEAQAQAEAIESMGMAEVRVLEAKAKVVSANQAITDYIRAQNWDGKYPTTFMGDTPGILMNMK